MRARREPASRRPNPPLIKDGEFPAHDIWEAGADVSLPRRHKSFRLLGGLFNHCYRSAAQVSATFECGAQRQSTRRGVSVGIPAPPELTARLTSITVLPMATLTFKVTDREARLIRSRARRERVTVSEYLRRRASISLAPACKPAKVRCPYTGAMIFASLDNQPPLTTDTVRELLSDFP